VVNNNVNNNGKLVKIMKKKDLIMFSILASGMMFSCPIIADSANISDISSSTSIQRQERELYAEQLTVKANQSFLKGNYEEAKNIYLEAIGILTKIAPSSKENLLRINSLKDSLSNVYLVWSKNLLEQAKKHSSTGEIIKAEELCRQSVEMNPAITNEADKLLKQFSEAQKEIVDANLSNINKLDPSYKDKQLQIAILYEQGKLLYEKNKYDRAKEKFEKVLVVDPYNSQAIQYLQMVNKKIAEAGIYRTEVTQAERMAEIEWNKLTPLPSYSMSGARADYGLNQPISKQLDESRIQAQLNDIIIPHIVFEDVPINDAILFLKQESQKLDPSGKGVNFFLRLEPKQDTISEEAGWDEETASTAGLENINISEQYLISISLQNVTLKEAIKYICQSAGLKYRVNDFAVEIASPDVPFGQMEIRVLPFEREYFNAEVKDNNTADLKQFFVDRGVAFQEGSSVVYDPKISRLIVRNTQTSIEQIQKILDKLNTSLPQVSITAKLVEMGQQDFDELGFQWEFSKYTADARSWTVKESGGDINRYASSYDVGDYGTVSDKAFGFKIVKNDLNISSTLHALQQNKRNEVLSAPRVTTLSGNKAVIRVVENRVFPSEWSQAETAELGTGVNATISSFPTLTLSEATPLGVVFAVTPYVSSDHYTVDLELEPQVQSFDDWQDYSYNIGTKENKIEMPIITVRSIQTKVRLYDGETVVMGGVYEDKTTKVDDRVPIFGDMPLVGRFFRSEIENDDKTNLLIFTQVTLIKPDGSPLRPSNNRGLPVFN